MERVVTAGGPRATSPRAVHGPVLTVGRLALAIGVLAFAVRLGLVLTSGGLRSVGDYDDAVYYAAADALIHGRLPYGDFLFLQPPGILAVLAPFAALGTLIGDEHGFAAARLAFLAMGACSAALVVVVLRRHGRTAAVVGGVLYALFVPAIYAERSTLLEPVGSLAMLSALAVLGSPRSAAWAHRRFPPAVVAAGAVLGLATATKIWMVVPAAVIVLAFRRFAWPLMAGAVGAIVGCCAPFLATSPVAFAREVVEDQLGRPRIEPSPVRRLAAILQSPDLAPHTVILAAACAVLAAAAVLAVSLPGARVYVALLVATLVVLLVAPSFYRHYAALSAPAIALVAGAAAIRLRQLAARYLSSPRWVPPVVLAVVAALIAVAGWPGPGIGNLLDAPVPVAIDRMVASNDGCVMTDNPSVLISAGVLSRQLRAGCEVWPDFSGWRYDREGPINGRDVALSGSAAWQRFALHYLSRGDLVVLSLRSDGVNAATRAELGGVDRSWRGGQYHTIRTHTATG